MLSRDPGRQHKFNSGVKKDRDVLACRYSFCNWRFLQNRFILSIDQMFVSREMKDDDIVNQTFENLTHDGL